MDNDLLTPTPALADALDSAPAMDEAEGAPPPPKLDYEAEIARLAALSTIEYEWERVAVADKLNVRVSILDDEVKQRRPASDAVTGRGVLLPDVEPWPAPVPGGVLLDEWTAAIQKHVVLRWTAAEAVALWVAHTWVAERFGHTPRLHISSPAKRCGKSTLMDILRATCRRPLKADNISASGVFRTVEALAPLTLLLDEADSFVAENDELRGVLNSGFERSGNVVRMMEVSGEWQPLTFRTFAPLALAGIGALPSTLEDRAVPVVLQRKGTAEVVTKLRVRGVRADLADLARKLARWSRDRGQALLPDPEVPDAMGDREGDICVPLLAIADDAGPAWAKRGRAALLDVFGKRAVDEGNADTGALLLEDLRAVFRKADKLTSAQIVAALAGMEHRPWPEWKGGKPMTPPQLARALAPFGIRPQNGRYNGSVAKGYPKVSFTDAWMRYLPPEPFPDILPATEPPTGAATPLQPCKHMAKQQNAAATAAKGVAA